MEKLVIAAQLYTVRAYTQTEQGIAETLQKIRALGYGCVQISAFGACRTEFLRDALQANGLTACATHTPYERIVGDTDAVIREHKCLGIPYVGLGFRRIKNVGEAETFLREVLPAAEKIAGSGLKFLYHNHHWEFARMENGQTVMQYLLEHTPPAVFGLLPDCYWLQAAGLSPERFLAENSERIGVIHLKDLRIDRETDKQCYAEVFEGNMDYAAICGAARRAGIRYAAVEQDECYGKDPFRALETSLHNIRARLGGAVETAPAR